MSSRKERRIRRMVKEQLRKEKKERKRRTRSRSRSVTSSSSAASSFSRASYVSTEEPRLGRRYHDRSRSSSYRERRVSSSSRSRSSSEVRKYSSRSNWYRGDSPPRKRARRTRSRSRSRNYSENGERSPRGTTRKSRSGERSPRGASRKKTDQVRSPRGATRNSGERSPRGASGNKTTAQHGHENERRDTPTNSRSHGEGKDAERRTTSKNTENRDESRSNDFALLLDDDLLELVEGDPIDDTLADKWAKIVQAGLKKDTKMELIKKYPVPKNCQTLKAPELNDEFHVTLGRSGRSKDNYQVVPQNQLGVAIGILGRALTKIMETNDVKTMTGIFEPVKDACRLLADLHNGASKSRRHFAASSLDPSRKAIALEQPIDKKLFGENFSTKLKAVEDAEKAAKSITKTKSSYGRRDSHHEKYGSGSFTGRRYKSNPLNWKGLSRKNHAHSRPERGSKSYNQQHGNWSKKSSPQK